MSEDARGCLFTAALFAIVIALLCGKAMYVTGEDNACTAVGGHLEFADTWFTEVCMRDGQVIEP